MYIKKDFLQLGTDELTRMTAEGYALCYIEEDDRRDVYDDADDPAHEYPTHYGLRLFFTDCDLANQWGDDWNDAPYDCNAGWPYDSCYKEKDSQGRRKEHNIAVLNISIEAKHMPTLPSSYVGSYNTPFSVDDINQGAVAWMFFGKECKPIYAGATPLDVLERIGKWLTACPEVSEEEDEG